MPKPNLTYQATNERRKGSGIEEIALREALVVEPGNEFFLSLNQQYQRFGTLTAKQWAALARSFASLKIPVPQATTPSMSGPARKPDFDGTKVQELFTVASHHLKYPTMYIPGVEGLHDKKMKVYLSMHSPRYGGCILFTAGAQDIDKKVYAIINKRGEGFINTASMEHGTPEAAESICTAIFTFAADPVGYSKMTGIKYSHCCYCGLELTNASSVYHGYGPICAEKWGLPWGDRPKEASVPEL